MVLLRKIRWWLFAASCLLIGLYPLMYFVVDRRFGLLGSKSETLLSDVLWNIGFYGHILLGGLALLIGWMQFSTKLRKRNLTLHRNIGKVYVIAVLISGTCSLYIGFHATGGLISMLGFLSLGVIWLYTTIRSYLAIKKRDTIRHEIMMIYSYAACFGAVTLRIWLPLLIYGTGGFLVAYKIVAWLSWVPNMIVAYLIVREKQARISK
ncbi:MAG: DUF2306 domain-containing protein [Bacteroidia bacterium]